MVPMDLKPQDLLVVLKVAAHPPQRWTYALLGQALGLGRGPAVHDGQQAVGVAAHAGRAVGGGVIVGAGRPGWGPQLYLG